MKFKARYAARYATTIILVFFGAAIAGGLVMGFSLRDTQFEAMPILAIVGLVLMLTAFLMLLFSFINTLTFKNDRISIYKAFVVENIPFSAIHYLRRIKRKKLFPNTDDDCLEIIYSAKKGLKHAYISLEKINEFMVLLGENTPNLLEVEDSLNEPRLFSKNLEPNQSANPDVFIKEENKNIFYIGKEIAFPSHFKPTSSFSRYKFENNYLIFDREQNRFLNISIIESHHSFNFFVDVLNLETLEILESHKSTFRKKNNISLLSDFESFKTAFTFKTTRSRFSYYLENEQRNLEVVIETKNRFSCNLVFEKLNKPSYFTRIQDQKFYEIYQSEPSLKVVGAFKIGGCEYVLSDRALIQASFSRSNNIRKYTRQRIISFHQDTIVSFFRNNISDQTISKNFVYTEETFVSLPEMHLLMAFGSEKYDHQHPSWILKSDDETFSFQINPFAYSEVKRQATINTINGTIYFGRMGGEFPLENDIMKIEDGNIFIINEEVKIR